MAFLTAGNGGDNVDHQALDLLKANTLTVPFPPYLLLYSNTDKMTDQEKIPIAIAGIAFIALPFIAGLIALYSAK